jgi:uncharacterized protein (TIGR02231 family)
MRFAAFLCAITFPAAAASAMEVPAPTAVDSVTVFLRGAEVTRVGKVKIEKGEHTIVIGDLPASAVPGSIRVEGKATGKLDIGSVDSRRAFLARAESEAADAERKKLEDQLDGLRDQKAGLDAQSQAAETQKALITNLAQLPSRPAPAGGNGAAADDWQRVLSTISAGTADASRAQIDAQVKIRAVDRQIEDLEHKLSALAPLKTEQTEVKVFVEAGSPLEADLTIRYQVENASWTPLYDARLQTGSKTAPPRLDLARRASIAQRTGETWDNVTLQLSTARPASGAAAPELQTQTVDFQPEFKPVPVAAPAPPPMREQMLRKDKADAARAQAEDAVAETKMAAGIVEPAPIADVESTTIIAPFEATYAVPGKATIPQTGEAKRVVLTTEQSEPVLSCRTVPKADTNAYLYAKLKLAKGTPLLPGQVYLFRDGTFVGTGQIPLLAAGEEHDLGFGIDDQVKVRHAVVEEKRGETGLISTSRTDIRNYRVNVKNLHERAISVTVFDQLPVSQNQDIKVEYTGKAAPTKQNVDDKRGVFNFEAKLEPEEEKVLDYGYQVSWPAAKTIIYGP